MEKIDFSIFKSYDIRGVYPSQINKEIAFQVGTAFADYSKAKKVVIGRDGRNSSEDLFNGLKNGLFFRNVEVYDLGQVPTECLYFAVSKYGFDGGIMITASHNPKEYNGFKMIYRKGEEIEVARGKDIAEVFKEAKEIKTPEFLEDKEAKKLDVFEDYLKHIFNFVDLEKIGDLKVAIDASNGMAVKIIPKIIAKLPIKTFLLNFEINGNFPGHSPNPLSDDAVFQIKSAIKEKGADFGFIFDGDADRIFLVTKNGKLLRGDITLLLLTKHFLKVYPGKGVVFNVICSRAVPEFIEKWGGKPVKSKVGFVNIRKKMMEEDAIIGGEVSGHYCFRDNFYFDSASIAFLVLLQLISEEKRKLDEIAEELSPYAKSNEINFQTTDKETLLNEIKNKYADGKQSFLDGVTVEYNDWWFNIRPSQTEPLLRLTIEAKTKDLLEEKIKELTEFIKKRS